jgi:hypothetical protein
MSYIAGISVGVQGHAPIWNSETNAVNMILNIPAGWIFAVTLLLPCCFYLYDEYGNIRLMQGRERKIAIVKYIGVMIIAFIGVLVLLSVYF